MQHVIDEWTKEQPSNESYFNIKPTRRKIMQSNTTINSSTAILNSNKKINLEMVQTNNSDSEMSAAQVIPIKWYVWQDIVIIGKALCYQVSLMVCIAYYSTTSFSSYHINNLYFIFLLFRPLLIFLVSFVKFAQDLNRNGDNGTWTQNVIFNSIVIYSGLGDYTKSNQKAQIVFHVFPFCYLTIMNQMDFVETTILTDVAIYLSVVTLIVHLIPTKESTELASTKLTTAAFIISFVSIMIGLFAYTDVSNCLQNSYESDYVCYPCRDYIDPYCRQCNATKCTQCDDGYQLKSKGCQLNTCMYVPNCNVTTCATCQKCNPGYYINPQKTCSPCFIGCGTCSSYDKCLTCASPLLFLYEDKCRCGSAYTNMTVAANGACLCDAGTFMSTFDLQGCIACKYMIPYCLQCNQTTSKTSVEVNSIPLFKTTQQYLNCTKCEFGRYPTATGECKSCYLASEGCASCNSIDGSVVCETCLQTHLLQNGNCISCGSLIKGCLKCTSTETCTLKLPV